MNQNGVKHTLTSLYHLYSNEFAELADKTVKQGISKLQGSI